MVYVMISEDIEIRIRDHLTSFLARKIQAIRTISMEDMEINPFLIATTQGQFAMKVQHDLAAWLVRQRIERSMVSGFGVTLQEIAKEFCHEKPLPNITARMIREGKTYNIMIKSGSNHNIAVISRIQQVLLNSQKTDPDSIPIFGICYGNPESVGAIMRKYSSGVRRIVGREFWSFISGDSDCYDRILEIARDTGKHYKDSGGNSLEQAMTQKIGYITEELEELYGKNPSTFWKNLVRDAY